ncbi:endonuclease SmrB [Colwellia hornerae]|uniref:Ribosome rescue factor SmrB n=1 Tax=Colwellia hornerae TaxID=89402 RepID=A0A5C6QPF6_9GAMM|nr:endonuclease SmrB [Colwellia hornerae]TWX56318.1 endonuclease SmrB [Colwellia hornerae]TWX62169.1 endonuclease SmrB [Colwellia hornerae]TWX70571.1 endonuclease SmrB [Colwellia hornerae]
MKFKDALTPDEKDLFMQAIGKVKPIVQDKIAPIKKQSKNQSLHLGKDKGNAKKKQHAEFYFSDEFEPNLNQQGPMKYVRKDVDSFEAKNLRRGQYAPDLILDLHGLDQKTAKLEIAALMFACKKEHAKCVCIVHGLGSQVLKNKVPHWLVQHPDVMAFHQAPLEWGGNGALLVLVELNDRFADII